MNPKYSVELLCCSLCGARYKNDHPQCDCIERWARDEIRAGLVMLAIVVVWIVVGAGIIIVAAVAR